MEQRVTLKIFGRDYTFKNETGDPDASEVATLFEDAVRKVKSKFINKKIQVDQETILILTGINIASDYYKLKKQQNQMINRMNQRTVSVLDALNKAVC